MNDHIISESCACQCIIVLGQQEAIFYSKSADLRHSPLSPHPSTPLVMVTAVTRPPLEEKSFVASKRSRALGTNCCAQAAEIVHVTFRNTK